MLVPFILFAFMNVGSTALKAFVTVPECDCSCHGTDHGFYVLEEEWNGASVYCASEAAQDEHCCNHRGLKAAQPPHIVVILADDAGWNNVGFHNSRVKTPALDALKHSGIEFTRHYAYYAGLPSRCSFLSGRHPPHVNQGEQHYSSLTSGIHPSMTTIPRKMKMAGYRTVFAGKWQVGFAMNKTTPKGRGFDSSLTLFHGMFDHFRHTNPGDCLCRDKTNPYHDLWLNDGPAPLTLDGIYSSELFGNHAVAAIHDHPASTPLFLMVSFPAPHLPYQVPLKYSRMYKHVKRSIPAWRKYQAMQTSMDEAVGNIVAALQNKSMWDNTLMIWASDNGAMINGDHGGSNFPLRGGKNSPWEGGLRVPTVVGGGIIPASRRGTTYSGASYFADWFTTFSTLAGVSEKDATSGDLPAVDGRDLSGAIFDGSDSPWKDTPVLIIDHTSWEDLRVLMWNQYKLIKGPAMCGVWSGDFSPNHTHNGNLCGEEVLYGYHNCTDGCLYNVDDDMGEHNDLRWSHPEVVSQMVQQMEEEQTLVKTVVSKTSDPGPACCEVAKRNGGFWGPWAPDTSI